MKEVLRLTKPLVEILEPYNVDDAGKAIKAMQVYIDYQRKEIEKLQSVADALQKSIPKQPVYGVLTDAERNASNPFNEEYWKKMEALIRKCNGKPSPEFQKASQIKTIGKIDPDEQLEEPMGRQGREVR